jgi:hypothetical protein
MSRFALLFKFNVCILIGLKSFSQSDTNKIALEKYSYINQKIFGSLGLNLFSDHTFLYEVETDLQKWFSKGKWRKVKDTLIINDDLRSISIPISVEELEDKNEISSKIKFEMVQNLDSNFLHGARLCINGDTMNYCMPAFEDDCNYSIGAIRSIAVLLDPYSVISSPHFLKNLKANRILIRVHMHGNFKNYLNFGEKKYLIKNNRLYEIISNGTGKLNSKEKVKKLNLNYFLTKRKI